MLVDKNANQEICSRKDVRNAWLRKEFQLIIVYIEDSKKENEEIIYEKLNKR